MIEASSERPDRDPEFVDARVEDLTLSVEDRGLLAERAAHPDSIMPGAPDGVEPVTTEDQMLLEKAGLLKAEAQAIVDETIVNVVWSLAIRVREVTGHHLPMASELLLRSALEDKRGAFKVKVLVVLDRFIADVSAGPKAN